MKKKIIYGLLLAVAMVTASSSFVSCKDYEGDDVAELRNQNAALKDYIDAQIAAIKQCNCDPTIAGRLAAIEADYLKAAALNGYATEAWVNGKGFTTLSDVQTWVNQQGFSTLTMEAVQQWVNAQGFLTEAITEDQVKTLFNTLMTQKMGEINTLISEMITTALANGENPYWTKEDVINYFNTQKPDLSGYATKEDIDNLRNYILLGDSVKNAYVWADYSYRYILAHADTLKMAYNQSITNRDSIAILADSIDNVAAQALENFNQAKQLADSAISLAQKALDSVNIVNAKVSDLEDAMKVADAKLQAQIDTLKDRVAANEKSIENIVGTLKKQITGVIIQAAYSPVLGNGSLPFGVQTNVLAAYVGKASADVDFPSYFDEDYADGTTVLTPADQTYLQGIGYWPAAVSLNKGQYILSDREDNAGKLYLTVNPTNTDFTGTTFDMVNSAGQVSRMQLSDLQPCKDVLNFGWTRGGVATTSNNGFYVANAKVTEENIKALQANIDAGAFKKAFSEQLHSYDNGTGLVSYTAAMDLLRAVYGSLEPLQRNGIRATWLDDVAGCQRSYTSAFDVAATVVAPLGFGFGVDFLTSNNRFNHLPVFDTNYLKNRFHFKGEVKLLVAKSKESGENVIFCEIPVLDLDPELMEVYYDADGNIVNYYNGRPVYYDTDWGGYYNFYGDELRSGYAYIDFTELLKEAYDEINAGLSSVQDILNQANKRIDWVVKWIDKYNKYAIKVNKFIKNANNLLQPVLLWCDGQNVGQLGGITSGNYAVGTIVPAGGAVALVPTTYTLELLAPSFKKSVICTNVYKDGKSAQGAGGDLDTAVKDVNKALKAGGFDLYEGQDLKNAFIFDAKSNYEGMTFEFAYTAVDYTGQIAGRKFYLTVGPAAE